MTVQATHTPDTPPDPIIGIDLGTTNSVVAFADDRGPRVLVDPTAATGERAIFPSVVRFAVAQGRATPDAVGDDARSHAVEFPERTIYSVKRLMGRSIRDAAADTPYLAYDVVPGAHDTARIRIPAQADADDPHSDNADSTGAAAAIITPQEVSAIILRALKDRASRALGRKVRRAVVTVPAYFDDAQRQATRDAGRLAGLDVLRIVNEPTAAALAYGLGLTTRAPQTIAVYDLGGGTFDVSILAIEPSEAPPTPSPGSAGEGGRRPGEGSSPPSSPQPLPSSPPSPNPSVAPSLRRSVASPTPADFFQVLSTAGDTHLGGDDIDQLIVKLVMREISERFGVADISSSGAPSLPSATRQALRSFAEATKIRLSEHDSAAMRIDLGEGRIYERVLTRDELEDLIRPLVQRSIDSCKRALRDAKLTPKDIDRVVMVGGATRTPLVRRMVGEFFQCEPYTALDPDLVVALGAAVQGSIVGGLDRSRLLLDVIPLSLGIETAGGAVAKLIMRNQSAPARATERFTTQVDGQTSIKIHVLQGEREMVEHCRSLGEFHLRNLPPMPAGVPQLEVEFLVDASGVLNVSAVEKRSGKRAALQVIPSHGLTREEVERIESESFAHAREDMTRHRIVDLVANARLDIKWTRDQLARIGPKLDPAYRKELESLTTELAALVDRAAADWRAADPDTLHTLKETLDRATMRMHEVSITESLRADERA